MLNEMFTAYTQGILNIFDTIFVGKKLGIILIRKLVITIIGTSFGRILRFSLSSSETMKVVELPELSLDGNDSCPVYCLNMTCRIQLVCGDGMGRINVWSNPEQLSTVQSQFDHGKG